MLHLIKMNRSIVLGRSNNAIRNLGVRVRRPDNQVLGGLDDREGGESVAGPNWPLQLEPTV